MPQRIYQRRIFIKDCLVDVSNHVVEGLDLACILVELPGIEKPGSVFVKALVQKQRFYTARFFVEQSLQIFNDAEGRIQFRAIAHDIELERHAIIQACPPLPSRNGFKQVARRLGFCNEFVLVNLEDIAGGIYTGDFPQVRKVFRFGHAADIVEVNVFCAEAKFHVSCEVHRFGNIACDGALQQVRKAFQVAVVFHKALEKVFVRPYVAYRFLNQFFYGTFVD